MENIFRGLGTALITPFLPNGEIDYQRLEELIDYQIDGGVDFICVLGTTAETPCLSKEERDAVKNFVVEKTDKRVPILLGCGGNNTAELVRQLNEEDFDNIDGILSVSPYYNKPSQEGLYQHFKQVAAATELPVILYNVPGRTGVNLSAETIVRLANDCENVVAVKEASGNISQIEDILKYKPANFDLLSGDDGITYEILALGGVGVISVISNAYPAEFNEMVKTALTGDRSSSLAIHRHFNEMFKLLSVDGNPAGIKTVLAEMGKIDNVVRLPLVSASADTQAKIKAFIQ